MADKKIKLYKVNSDGSLDKNSQLLPETDVESVKGEFKDALYEKVEKEIVIPNYAIDRNEYTLPTIYDFNKLTILTGENTIYEDTENHILIKTFSQDDFKVIDVRLEETSPYYSNQTNGWVIQESEADPVPYTEPITFTYNESCLKNEDYKELFSQILGIEPTIEHITIDRTLKEKNEDIKNWPYNRIEHKEKVYGLKDETQYKLNFNVGNVYEEFDFDSVALYLNDYESPDLLRYVDVNSDKTIRIDYGENVYFYRQSDLQWVDNVVDPSEAHIYTEEELENLTFIFSRSRLGKNHSEISDEQLETLFRKFVVNVDGTPVPEDHEEVIIEIKTVDDKFNEPLKDKLYQVIKEEVEVPNNITDGNEYYFKENMEINLQIIQEYFKKLKSGDYIYNNNGECIQYIVDTPSGKVDYAYARLRYIDSSSNSYDYLIANIMSLTPTFINKWEGGSLDFSITIYTEYIMNEDILKLMLNLGTHKEIIYKNQTLEEKNDDLPNWKYGAKEGILDIPNWNTSITYRVNWLIIYEESQVCQIQCNYNSDGITYEIYDIVNNIRYTISNYAYDEFKANTWYKWSLIENDSMIECNTPNIILNKSYVKPLYEELFNAIYGLKPLTLKQKIDEIEEKINNVEPLKDKIYSNSGDLVDGEEYKLKEDYTEFFNKYAHGQSTLIYGEDNPTPSPTPIRADAISTKDGEVMDLPSQDIEVPTNRPTILGIYLYTDSTPIIKGELTRDGASQYDGGDMPAPDYPVLGGASIDVYTNQGTITFNQGGDGWYYYATRLNQKIPTDQLPTLILDSSLIKNEEMLKDFIGGSSITLEEKFNEVEYINEGYKPLFVPDWSKINEIKATPQNPQVIYSDDFMTVSVYSSSHRVDDSRYKLDNYVKFEFDDIYYKGTNYSQYSPSQWSKFEGNSITPINNQNQLPDITFEDKYIINGYKDLFYSLLYVVQVKVKDKLIEEINAPLKNRIYEHIEESYTLLDIPNWEDMGEALSDWHQVYAYTPTGSEFANMIYLGEWSNFANHSGVFLNIVDENSQSKDYAIFNEDWTDSQEGQGFEVKANTWYKVTYDYNVSPYTRTYEEEIPDLIINNEGIKDIDLFKCVYNYQEEQTITLGEVVEGNLKDKTYDTIPETYKLLTPNWENIDVSKSYYSIYIVNYSTENYEEGYCDELCESAGDVIEDYSSQEIYEIAAYKVIGYDPIEDRVLKEEYYNLNKDCVVGHGSSQQLTKGIWYKGTYDDNLGYYVFEEVDNIEMLFHEDNIIEEYKDLFNQLVQYIPEQKITLNEKLNGIEPPYTITDYTEDNGTLTSITVKDKATGEPTILTVGGEKTYQHNIKIVYSQTGNPPFNISFKITNDNKNALTRDDVINYLIDKECNSRDNSLEANGQFAHSVGANDYHYICQGVFYLSSNFYMWGSRIGESSYVISEVSHYENGYSDFKDKVIPL